MLFNSIAFAIFLPIVFLLYWNIPNGSYKKQNILLLLASYIFYGSWDWRFLFLLIFSTLLDYYTGLKMVEADRLKQKKIWFWLSISVNLGFLGVFKYYNFFVESFSHSLNYFGIQTNLWSLQVILPVGISFYTFHGLSYVIDIYYNRIKPEKNFIDYSLFVSFFPLLVAGPIERATHLLPQITNKRTFSYSKSVDGMRQILWGLFKKVVIADNCAIFVNDIFSNYQVQNSSTLLLGAILFAFQIYGDFSGYSDIALGTARLFGIELLRNFAYPYFSRDIAEFWRKWHISLTTWFRDYLYIPLGGSRGGKWQAVRNTFIIFLVSGFWHGANWTFIVWGGYHAALFMPLLIFQKNRKNTDIVAQNKLLPNPKEIIQISFTFLLVVIGWIIFRADNVSVAYEYIKNIFSWEAKNIIDSFIFETNGIGFFIILMLFVEWFQRRNKHGLEISTIRKAWIRIVIYYAIIASMLYFMGKEQTFIYFQF